MDRLACTAELIAATPSPSEKIALLAAYFQSLDDRSLSLALHIFEGLPVQPTESRKLSVGHATLRAALQVATALDPETIALCFREVGNSGETVSLLCRAVSKNEPFPLSQAEAYIQSLRQTRSTSGKVSLLARVFQTHAAPALKYFVRALTGDLRIGLTDNVLEDAIATASGLNPELVRAASNRSGTLSAVALAARANALHTIHAVPFHSLGFMFPQALGATAELDTPENWYAEDKYDGIRAQIHVSNGTVAIFTPGPKDVTAAFPDVALAFAHRVGPYVIDGEILATRLGRPLPFHCLQERLAKQKMGLAAVAAIPVQFVAYDILMHRGVLIFDKPFEHRRKLLEDLQLASLSRPTAVHSHAHIDELFHAARARGNEGLVLKHKGSLYESGLRSPAWWKLTQAFATLLVVVTAAELSQRGNSGLLSNLTFAITDGPQFLNIGKAAHGANAAESAELARALRAATLERFAGGRVHLVRPEVVLEVAFDGLQRSPRHKSGYTLRSPRIVRWRRDKSATEIDSLASLRGMFPQT